MHKKLLSLLLILALTAALFAGCGSTAASAPAADSAPASEA